MEIPDLNQLSEFYSAYSPYVHAAGVFAAGYLLKTLRYSMTKKHWTAKLSSKGGVSQIRVRSRFGRTIQTLFDPDGDRTYRTKDKLHKEAVKEAESSLETRLRGPTRTTGPEPTEGQ